MPEDRVALVTGVGRRAGIGYAVACRLAAAGLTVHLHGHRPHDLAQPWGADDPQAVLAGVTSSATAAPPTASDSDLSVAEAAEDLVADVRRRHGRLDVLVCNHALSGSDGSLLEIGAAELDAHWKINTRASLLLVKAFAQRRPAGPGGRVVLLSSGQHLGPLRGEVAYAASKGALVEVTATLAEELATLGSTVNCVNPGPVDTGYATGALHEYVRSRFPAGRWGHPEDAAKLIGWLVSPDAEWITGQVINSEGGFRRSI